jgi:hypothetical protein
MKNGVYLFKMRWDNEYLVCIFIKIRLFCVFWRKMDVFEFLGFGLYSTKYLFCGIEVRNRRFDHLFVYIYLAVFKGIKKRLIHNVYTNRFIISQCFQFRAFWVRGFVGVTPIKIFFCFLALKSFRLFAKKISALLDRYFL